MLSTASYLLKTMDLDVDPCDDFYQYACGNFIRTTNIPDDKTSITTFSKINDDLTEQLRNVIEEPMTSKDPKSFSVAKKLYQACMNKSEHQRGSRVLLFLVRVRSWNGCVTWFVSDAQPWWRNAV